MELIWHIDRAQFAFEDPDEYEEWKRNKKIFFEFSPGQADDFGEDLFDDSEGQSTHFEITDHNGKVSVDLAENGPVITVWVNVSVTVNDDFDEERLIEWSDEMGGWASSTIDLGEYEAVITQDDGGDWRVGATA